MKQAEISRSMSAASGFGPSRRMSGLLAGLFFCLLFAVAAGAQPAGDPENVEQAGQRLEQLLADTQTMRASFHSQTLDVVTGRVLEETFGTLELSQPGRFRWENTRPYERLLITDGQQLWDYNVDFEEVTVGRMDLVTAGSPAALLGGARLSEGFRAIDAWAGEGDEQGLFWVRLEPLVPDRDFDAVLLAHDGTLIRQMRLLSVLGRETQVRFDDVVRNEPIADERFVFQIPAGVSVIGNAAP